MSDRFNASFAKFLDPRMRVIYFNDFINTFRDVDTEATQEYGDKQYNGGMSQLEIGVGQVTGGSAVRTDRWCGALRITPPAVDDEGYQIQVPFIQVGTGAPIIDPRDGRDYFIEWGRVAHGLGSRDLFLGVAHDTKEVLLSDGTFNSSNDDFIGFHSLNGGSGWTTAVHAAISGIVYESDVVIGSYTASTNAIDRFAMHLQGTTLLDFYYGPPGTDELIRVNSVNVEEVSAAGLNNMIPTACVIGSGSANHYLEVDYILVSGSRN